jgi:hypothetical protein
MEKCNKENCKGIKERRYKIMNENTIAKMIDNMEEHERKFTLWYLLSDYIKELDNSIEYVNCKDKAEFAESVMKTNHVKVGREMIICLTYDLW